MKKNKKEQVTRRVFITDTGKTLFYATITASVLPAVFTTSCTKDGVTDSQNGKLVISDDGLKHACSQGFVCFDEYECGGKKANGSFNCNHGFQCDDNFECSGPNFHCHGTYTMHEGGSGG